MEDHAPEGLRGREEEVFAEATEDIFDIDDGVIDDHADGHGEAAESHGVEGNAEGIEDEHGAEEGEGDGDERDKSEAEIEEKEDEDEGDEGGADEEGMIDIGEGGFDERGWSMEAIKDLDVFSGENGLEIGEGVFEGVGNGESIGTVLADHGDEHAGVAHDESGPESGFGGELNSGEVAEANDGRAIADDDFAKFFWGKELTVCLDDDSLIGGIDKARAADSAGGAGGFEHIGEGEVKGGEFGGLDGDLEFFDFAAEHIDMGDAGDGEEAGFESPIDERAEFFSGETFGDEPDFEEVHRGGGEWGKGWGSGGVWELASEGAEFFGEGLAGEMDVGVFFKSGGDDAESLDAFGADGSEIWGTIDGTFDGSGDEHFDLFGGETWGFCLDGDLGGDEFGKDIERGMGGDNSSVDEESDGQGDDDRSMAERSLDDEAEHLFGIWGGFGFEFF